jgi:hypothetical protein
VAKCPPFQGAVPPGEPVLESGAVALDRGLHVETHPSRLSSTAGTRIGRFDSCKVGTPLASPQQMPRMGPGQVVGTLHELPSQPDFIDTRAGQEVIHDLFPASGWAAKSWKGEP